MTEKNSQELKEKINKYIKEINNLTLSATSRAFLPILLQDLNKFEEFQFNELIDKVINELQNFKIGDS